MYKTEFISSFKEFQELGSIWDQVLEESYSHNIHLQYEWLFNWYKYFGKESQLSIILIKEEEKIIAIAPLIIIKQIYKKIIPYKQLVFIGDKILDWGDFIVLKNDVSVYEKLFSEIFKLKFNEILLHNIPPNSFAIKYLKNNFAHLKAKLKEHSPCLFIDSSNQDWLQYYKTTSFKFIRKDLRRCYNNINKYNWHFEISAIDNVSSEIDKMEVLYNNSQGRKNRFSNFDDKYYKLFLLSVIEFFKKKNQVRLFYLNINDKPVAFYLCFIYKNVLHFYNTGYDPIYSKLSPAKVLMKEVIQYGFNNGFSEINFMRGFSDYKTKWTNSYRKNFQFKLLNSRSFFGIINRFRST